MGVYKVSKIASIALFLFNPFVPSAPFLYSLKTSESLRFSVLGGRKRVHRELKYKTKMDSGHVPTPEMGIFVTKAIVAKGSFLGILRGPGYIFDDCCNSNPVEQKIIIKVSKIYF